MNTPVSLQINLAAGDYPYVRLLLPHQLNTLSAQADEVILTVDTRQSKGQFANSRWHQNNELLYDFLNEEIERNFRVKIIPVDYSPPMKRAVAEYFLGLADMPDKDFRGGPFYAYFFGLYMARNNLVFHLDSDIFLGGGSQTWISEAAALFERDERCLFVSPLPGPPREDGLLTGQPSYHKTAPFMYEIKGASSRLYMTDKSRLAKNKLELVKPPLRSQLKAMAEGNPNADLPEHMFKNLMEKGGFRRIDFLGQGQGLWSLHPPYHSQLFYDRLPVIIANIEINNLPASQYGFYDLVNEVCDWTEDERRLKENRWWKKLYDRFFK